MEKKKNTPPNIQMLLKNFKFVSVSVSQVLIENFSSSFIVSFSRADWDKFILSPNNCSCTFHLEEMVPVLDRV